MSSVRRSLAAVLLTLAVAAGFASAAQAAPLDLDADFGSGGIVRTNGAGGGRWSALHVYGDGTFLVAGQRGSDKVALRRFAANGAPDPGFAADQPTPGVLVFGGGNGRTVPAGILALPDGKLLVGYSSQSVTGGSPTMNVARATADGHLDTTFGASGIATVAVSPGGVALGGLARQSSGAIVLAGTQTSSGSTAGIVARLTAGGATDNSFDADGQERILLAGAQTRFDDVAVDGADRILLVGARLSGATNRRRLAIARLAPDGTADATYGTDPDHLGFSQADLDGAPAATTDVEGRRLSLDAGGTALVAATVTSGASPHLLGFARFTPGGTPDGGFGAGGTRTQDVSPSHVADLEDLGPLPGGGFAVAGSMVVGSTTQVALAGYHADGSPDTGLNPGHGATSNAANIVVGEQGDDFAAAIGLTPEGRLLAAGTFATPTRDDGFILRVGGTASAPVAAFIVAYAKTAEGRPIRPGQTVTFDASASSDADGKVTAFAWDLDGDGQTDHTGPVVTTSYAGPGAKGVLLRVTDDTGRTGTTGQTLDVAANQPPGVGIIEPAAAAKAGKPYTLSAFAGDADGKVTSYAWDLDGNGSFETSTGATSNVTTTYPEAGPRTVHVQVTDDEGLTAQDADTFTVGEGPCADNPVLRIEKAVIVTQGTAQGSAGCFHAVTTDKTGERTTRYTTTGHFRVNGLEVDTLGASQAVLIWKRKTGTARTGKKVVVEGATTQLTLEATNAHVEGTSKGTTLAFRDGPVGWDLSGDKIVGFKVDANASIGGLPLKVAGPPALDKDGTSVLPVLPGTPPELLGKTPDKPIPTTFGPSANAAAEGDFSFEVDTIPLGVITLGPVKITYIKAADRWDIAAKASMAVPVPTTLDGKLALVKGKVKMVDLQFHGSIPAGPLLITQIGLTIDFGPKVDANPNCVKHVGLEDITPYEGWKFLEQVVPGYKAYVLAHDGPNQVLFHQIFKDYKTPNFALCGSITLSVAQLLDAGVGFGFARYPSPLPNVFFFHGDATLIKLIKAKIDAEITTEGYVHVGAGVKGGYPENDPWIGWELGLDFEYFKEKYNAEAFASITVVPLDFTAGARLLASSNGIAACLTIDTAFGDWHPGGGAKWGHGPTLYFFGCDVNDYKVVIKHALSGDIIIGPPVQYKGASAARVGVVDRVPEGGRGNEAQLVRLAGTRPSAARRSAIRAAAAQAAPDAIDVPAGLPGTVMAFKGAGAPPHVVLHGPKGETIDTGAGTKPMHTPGVAALKNPATGLTEVVIAKPAGGRWTVEVAGDSSRLVEALQADGTVPARITGKVAGRGEHQRLLYSVTGLREGESLDFAEVGAAAGSIIGHVKHDGRGSFPFRAADGAAGKRDLQAIVTGRDGFVADRRALGTFRAPGPRRPAAIRRARIRRSGRSLVLSWPRDRLAKTTQVDVRTSTGVNLTRIVRRPSLKLPAPRAGSRLRLTFAGTSRTGVLGPSTAIAKRVPAAKRRRAKRRG